MKTFCSIILLICLISRVNANPFLPSAIGSNFDTHNCPDGYSQNDLGWDSCYKIYPTLSTRTEAVNQCRKDNGSLTSVPNAFVNWYIFYLGENIPSPAPVWLGIECQNGSKTNCVNDDNTKFVFENFYPGEPKLNQNCTVMAVTGRASQSWLSTDCDQKYPFVCEVAAAGEIDIYPLNFTEINGMNYGIFYEQPSMTRDQQSAQCTRWNGGQLATIPNKQVSDFIFNQGSQYYIRIGMRCPNVTADRDTSSCVWDDGTPFEYSDFYGNWPQKDVTSSCVWTYQGVWKNNLDCNFKFSYFACQSKNKQLL